MYVTSKNQVVLVYTEPQQAAVVQIPTEQHESSQ